jgi:hypothetical protein
MSLTKVLVQSCNIPSRLGEKLGCDWLTYNPGVYVEFAMFAQLNAPLFAQSLAETFPNASRICDIGAGTGHFVRALNEIGKNADGFEYAWLGRFFAKLIGVRLGSLDFTKTPSIPMVRNYDIAMSVEVGEHIPTCYSKRFVQTLTNIAPLVLLTCARPGQRGRGHINCQPKSFWKNLFHENGFYHDDCGYEELHANLLKHSKMSSFIPTNLMVFRRRETLYSS